MRSMLISSLLIAAQAWAGGVSWEYVGPSIVKPDRDFRFPYPDSKPPAIYSRPSGPYIYYELMRSTDNGMTWERIKLSPASTGGMWQHAFDPFIETRVYALCAGRAVNPPIDMPRQGACRLFYTDDMGKSWRKVHEWLEKPLEPASIALTVLKMDTNRQGVIYVGNDDFRYRSLDYGMTWDTIEGIPDTGIRDVAFHPRARNVVYLSARKELWRSDDGGKTWIGSDDGRGATDQIIVDPENPDVVYIHGGGGVGRSTDGGMSFKVVFGDYDRYFVRTLAIHPHDPRKLYAGLGPYCHYRDRQGGLATTDDGGDTWQRVTNLPPEAEDIDVIAIAPWEPFPVLLANDGAPAPPLGPLISMDGGKTWDRPIKSPGSGSCMHIAVWPRDENVMAIAEWDPVVTASGLWMTEDGGRKWDSLVIVEDGKTVCCHSIHDMVLHPEDHRKLFVCLADGIYVTEDRGKTWRKSSAGIPPEIQIWNLVIHPKDPQLMFAAGWLIAWTTVQPIFVSRDGGETWAEFPTGTGQHNSVVALALDPEDTRVLYLLREPAFDLFGGFFEPGNLEFTLDGGQTWNSAFTEAYAIGINPHRREEVYLAASIHDLNPDWSGIALFRSEDRGFLWDIVHIFKPLPLSPSDYVFPSCIAFDGSDPDTVYVGVGPSKAHWRLMWVPGAVLRSQDQGVTWENISSNVAQWGIMNLVTSPSGSIFAGTDGAGVWRLTYTDDIHFIRGDMNQDGRINISDAMEILNFVGWNEASRYSTCFEAANADSDAEISTVDAIYLLSHIFLLGPPPRAPFPACGKAEGALPVGCHYHAACME